MENFRGLSVLNKELFASLLFKKMEGGLYLKSLQESNAEVDVASRSWYEPLPIFAPFSELNESNAVRREAIINGWHQEELLINCLAKMN